jgi:hypothetical protein
MLELLREVIRGSLIGLPNGGLVGRVITPKRVMVFRNGEKTIVFEPGRRYIVTSESPLRISPESSPYAGTPIKRNYSSNPPGRSQQGFPSGHHMLSKSVVQNGIGILNLDDWEYI